MLPLMLPVTPLQKHCSRMFKSALVIALFAGVFHGQSRNSTTLLTIYTNIINVGSRSRAIHVTRSCNDGCQLHAGCAAADAPVV